MTAPHRAPGAAACPCGSGSAFGACCLPILEGEQATTALALMRSRFTAFALGDEDHLLRSWHPRTRPAPPYVDPAITWERLEILGHEAGAVGDAEGIVEFAAHWRGASGARGVMRELSRFERRAGRWVYVDGEVR
ncbi:YchJ family protein [Actinomyces culturomici]|uniref:YchJ family protein n=1 Tax=Actinomyces culturomici TaxID=1926276 RepID=UPI000E1FBE0D|nr:YchJ family metal-binding protein [Actinomyces culturomici]